MSCKANFFNLICYYAAVSLECSIGWSVWAKISAQPAMPSPFASLLQLVLAIVILVTNKNNKIIASFHCFIYFFQQYSSQWYLTNLLLSQFQKHIFLQFLAAFFRCNNYHYPKLHYYFCRAIFLLHNFLGLII